MYMVLLVSGLQADAGKFFLFMLGIFGKNMAAAGLVLFIGAAVGIFTVAQTIYTVLLVFAMVQHIAYFAIIHYNCVCSFCRYLVGSL